MSGTDGSPPLLRTVPKISHILENLELNLLCQSGLQSFDKPYKKLSIWVLIPIPWYKNMSQYNCHP